MDRSTLAAYDGNAAGFAQDWHDQPAPEDLHAIVRQYFAPGACADIGCGSGREVGWLDACGFAAHGYDASEGLLAEARRRYPQSLFTHAALPALAGIADASFDNVLCETVIMHLPAGDIAPSVARMVAILKPGGTLYLSWRVTKDGDQRDKHARLYASFDAGLVRGALQGCALLLDEEAASASSGKVIHRLVARKAA
ncbi:class I SAM-dependent methyltransferase [Herbaspirillum sp.]|uniref:class I SAM-dependent methyltransferase n=1 Tax=Herbaspirillum sp. TaxID=1890675 RepID=UPI001B13F489|nr:class I SAM-dependent methyltransferase [Herbaspirillum sp.]MBO9536101.1 class I SAM-dependent methyltransferase [Herbaspirillum sp.]